MLNLKTNYNPWKVNKKDFPANGGTIERMRFLLKYAVLAPSSLNTQPWEFKVTKNSITVLADKSRVLKSVDPTLRDFYISIGCAIANIIEAAKGLSLDTELKLNNDQSSPECAIISIKNKSNDDNDSLINFIPKRFSDKGRYNKKKIPKPTLDVLSNSLSKTCSVDITSENSTRLKIIEYIVAADHKVMSNLKFRKEISHWLKPNFTNSKFGMPGFTMGLNLIQSIISPYLVRKLNKFADIQSKKDRELLLSSPYFGIISITTEDKMNLLEAGILYEKMCLYATKSSFRITPLSVILGYEEGRDRLRTVFGSNRDPVMFFRMGYSNNKEIHSPRKGIR